MQDEDKTRLTGDGSGSSTQYSGETPVLFLVWCRSDVVEKVFSQIRIAKPKRLYVAVDGPRNDSDRALIEKTLNVINVDWDCDVKYLKREKNLGCKRAVSEAITWFFEHEEMGIILEDDCYPDLSFFPYCEELLNKYKDDTRIMVVSGHNGPVINDKHSYVFSKYFNCWGWATWRRAWKYFDISMADYELFKQENAIARYITDRWDRFIWSKELDMYAPINGTSWAFVFAYNILCNNGLCIQSCKNLIKNIGMGAENSTHCTISMEDTDIETASFPLKHPHFIGVEPEFNNSNMFKYIKKSFIRKFLRFISNFIPNRELKNRVKYFYTPY